MKHLKNAILMVFLSLLLFVSVASAQTYPPAGRSSRLPRTVQGWVWKCKLPDPRQRAMGVTRICVAVQKMCLNDCSGRGECSYSDAAGESTAT